MLLVRSHFAFWLELRHNNVHIVPSGPLLSKQSIYVLGYAFIGVALAMKNGHAGYFDHGFVQTIHILLHPIIMFAVSMLAEYWVATIPPQV